MARQRTLTKLSLEGILENGKPAIYAEWTRADGSKGEAWAKFRLATAERWYIQRLSIHFPTVHVLRDVPLARITDAVNADPHLRAWLEGGLDEKTLARVRRDTSERPRLVRPDGHKLDDDFYAQVAAAYTAAVAAGLPPAKTLADESGVPQGTVNRWIAKAREKHLPSTTAGKVRA